VKFEKGRLKLCMDSVSFGHPFCATRGLSTLILLAQ